MKKLLVLLLAVLLAGCQANPITGRNQLLIVSDSQAISASANAYTQMMGDLGKKKQIEANDSERVRKIHEISNRLIAQAVKLRPDSASWQWEVQVINDPKQVNAFCMAGGKMAIYTGLLEQVKPTDDEVAQVMGHEIAHALANHTRERMSVAMASTAAMTAAAIALQGRE